MIGWDARGESEQLVLQEQRRASSGAVQRAGPVAGPLKVNRKEESVTDKSALKYLIATKMYAYVQYISTA